MMMYVCRDAKIFAVYAVVYIFDLVHRCVLTGVCYCEASW